MYKRYKNYITSSDNDKNSDNQTEEINYDNKDSNINKNSNVNDNNYISKYEETKQSNNLKNDDFNNKYKEDTINIKKVLYCQPCDKRLESNQDYLLHMTSKKHKYKMKELLKKELKEYGSVKKLLIKEKMVSPFRRWRVNNVRYILYGFSLNYYLNE